MLMPLLLLLLYDDGDDFDDGADGDDRDDVNDDENDGMNVDWRRCCIPVPIVVDNADTNDIDSLSVLPPMLINDSTINNDTILYLLSVTEFVFAFIILLLADFFVVFGATTIFMVSRLVSTCLILYTQRKIYKKPDKR